MGFFSKLKRAVKKIKTKLIVYAILVLIIIILLVAPLSTAVVDAEMASGVKFSQNAFDSNLWATFFKNISSGIVSPLTQLRKCFSADYFLTFLNAVKVTLIAFGLFAIIGIIKAIPKHEYEDIENGSSDWCEGGEQYEVLSKNKGIILAEKHYLPVDKRGNVNILVVRRFWCW